jgi:hypothetical protein
MKEANTKATKHILIIVASMVWFVFEGELLNKESWDHLRITIPVVILFGYALAGALHKEAEIIEEEFKNQQENENDK